MELLENIDINKYAIILINRKQPLYKLIYALNLVEFETFKVYIETQLEIRFIQLFNSPINTLILFNKKSDDSICLFVNYQDFNNLTIKN